ncbi:basic amino acid/polyamine antiporter, APA family [Lentzea xinjiangensis]|uniref:Basic amino acid/polyamine antiporter, APA family n=1 Tax=Lentzea xinjiangensis TaxID=402600 RepID=A0A1H9HWE2_9PSEU|nr:amino acid permease [Lentzea xinjiangensis]SEQ66630.1 basic amino acid/polyamine antiporter, APA family [Lentzea xinjiangensis]
MTHTPRDIVATVALGLPAVLGAGVFAGFAPAAGLAGWWVLPALAVSALAALCSAFSTADQSRAYPDIGGGYGYVRAQLGVWPARLTASAHLLGRFAMAAAVASMFGAYVVPDQPVAGALALVVATALLGAAGFRFTTGVSVLVTVVVLGVLALVVASSFAIEPVPSAGEAGTASELVGVAGVMFMAFAGFERITAPHRGERPHSPAVLRFAIPILIGLSFAVYLAVGAGVLRQLGSARLALSPAPLRDALVAADASALVPLVQIAAAVAGVAVLHFVLASAHRTVTGLAEDGDLPTRLRPGAISLVLVAASALAVVLLPVGLALGTAACATLFYYAFTNASARVLLQNDRTWPMRTACLGLGLSVLLAMSTPVPALLISLAGLGAGTGLIGLTASLRASLRGRREESLQHTQRARTPGRS